ncbi:MAG TPA: methyltransferase domain-containing protein [Solirubrobacteraceae bacterium]|nr:methyltransferase domain-containing protein [Solirubrobacteraceae bacterium]
MGLIQHKREAYWFYRFLSLGYDRWVNPLFWTAEMRARALAAARLDARGLDVLDAGAGTGFTTEGIVERVDAARVTMLDQSPHQLARARRKPALAACPKLLGDAEALPFEDASFDRYVSAGSIEYWPDPQRGIAEAHRVLREGGTATLIGPVEPANAILRRLASTWMLFPPEADYRAWFERAGFADVEVSALAPGWYRGRSVYAVAVTGTRRGPTPVLPPAAAEQRDAPLTLAGRARFLGRFVVGAAAGFAFVPIGAALALRARLARR